LIQLATFIRQTCVRIYNKRIYLVNHRYLLQLQQTRPLSATENSVAITSSKCLCRRISRTLGYQFENLQNLRIWRFWIVKICVKEKKLRGKDSSLFCVKNGLVPLQTIYKIFIHCCNEMSNRCRWHSTRMVYLHSKI
jgi:hypothetical protein